MIKNREPGDKKSDSFLHINSCKVQAPFGKEITCHRPKGRLDYQLTYLLNGDFEVVYNGESKRISEGFVLLPPNCPNLYTDFADTRRIYVHFSGTGVESILADANIKCGVYSLPFSPIVENMFARLIAEHNRREPVSLENGQLIYILYTLGKQQSSQRLPSDDVQDAVTYITTHFSDKIHIDGFGDFLQIKLQPFYAPIQGTNRLFSRCISENVENRIRKKPAYLFSSFGKPNFRTGWLPRSALFQPCIQKKHRNVTKRISRKAHIIKKQQTPLRQLFSFCRRGCFLL